MRAIGSIIFGGVSLVPCAVYRASLHGINRGPEDTAATRSTAQRSSGVARVSYDGKTVDYRSVAEIDRAIEALDREIAAAEGRRIVRQVRVTTAKGL
jgi:hypothetical protein